MPAPERLIALGAIGRPHGVRGEVRVHRFNPESTLLLELESVWLRRGEEARLVKIESARAHGDAVLLQIEGARGREAAEALRGSEICVPREALPPAAEDEVYHADLIGLRAEGADGSAAGEVVDILSYPSVDCLLVRSEEGEREVPLLEPYVEAVDLERGVVIVSHLEDLDLVRRKR